MSRPVVLACLGVGLAACASILGDFEVTAGGPEADAGGIDAAVDTGTAADSGAGEELVPVDVAVNLSASCATLQGATSGRITYCWGAQGLTPQIVGVRSFDVADGGFYTPEVSGGSALRVERLVGTAGRWFLASGGKDVGALDALSWGSNDSAQLGQGKSTTEAGNALPAPIQREVGSQPLRIAAAAGGTRHGCLVEAGALYCWGQDERCQTRGGAADGCVLLGRPPVLKAQLVGSRTRLSYEGVATGEAHTCAIARTEDSKRSGVVCFGDNGQLQGGQSADVEAIAAPVIVPGVPLAAIDTMEIAAGDRHTCSLIEGTTLYCWGANDGGQAAPGATTATPIQATVVNGLSGQLSMLRAGGQSTCVVTKEGESMSRALCFGRGALGRNSGVGVGPIELLMDFKALSISGKHGCAIARESADRPLGVYCWGENVARAVDPTTTDVRDIPVPRRVVFPARR